MSRRPDAIRNDERIVAAALQELALDPNVAMDQLAAAAGVGRATLYRRFPSRDELVATLRDLARVEALQAIRGARLGEGTATAALARLVAAVLPVADRYAVLAHARARVREPDVELVRPVVALLRRGRRSGEFAAQPGPEWWLAVMRAHFEQAAAAVAGGMPLDEAVRLCTAALLDGLRGRS
ncbi:MAG: helix-turn-helix domain-containing protein [Thermoleophilaceae bacterium]